MKMKMKKFGKMNSIFEFSILKLGCMKLFIKIWENFFFEILAWEGPTRTEVLKGLIHKATLPGYPWAPNPGAVSSVPLKHVVDITGVPKKLWVQLWTCQDLLMIIKDAHIFLTQNASGQSVIYSDISRKKNQIILNFGLQVAISERKIFWLCVFKYFQYGLK